MSLPVGVVGGGGFGRGLALASARVGRHVVLWSRSDRTLDDPKIRTTTTMADLAEASLLFVCVPSMHVAELAPELGEHLDGSHLLVHVSRGLIGDELGTLTHVLRTLTPCRRVGCLAGPLFGSALARGEPGGGIVGSLFPGVAQAVRDAIAGPSLRIYRTDDVIGVEIASAIVGLLALGVGFAQGIGLGPATQAVLATRGIFEAARIGVARGARERTFMGLAGFGDLSAAIAGDGRPEAELGKALAQGLALAKAAAQASAYVEGASIAKHLVAFADRAGLHAPISTVLSAVIDGTIDGPAAIEQLMAESAVTE